MEWRPTLLAPILLAGAIPIAAGTACRTRSTHDDSTGGATNRGAPDDEAGRVDAGSPPPAFRFACRLARPPTAVSSHGAGGGSPALAWGPGVLGLARLRDDGLSSHVEVARLLDGAIVGEALAAGTGAVRPPVSIAWSGDSFVFAWAEPSGSTTEVFVGTVDAAGNVRWRPSRLTETIRAGFRGVDDRVPVESKDPRVIGTGGRLVLSWRTRTRPEAQPLYFAGVAGLEVSPPVRVSGENDTVIDHQLVAWGDDVIAVYAGRFERTQRLVRAARLRLDPPTVVEDRMIADIRPAPEWMEVSAVAAGDDLLILWRTKTDWNSTSNVAIARLPAGEPAAPISAAIEGVRAATPTAHQPRRTFSAVPFAD
ncbi:MAG: hypothetical protein QME96_03865, partial [Myxococcota bacterium]|nr:hypothetical protein [Myxococcota bacterium]